MKNRIQARCTLGLPVLLVVALAGCQTSSRLGQRVGTFDNFGQVKLAEGNPAPTVYRGEAPKTETALEYLASLGVRTIIDLRNGREADADPAQEEALVRRVNLRLGPDRQITWKNLPCNGHRPEEVLAQFRDFLRHIHLPKGEEPLAGPFYVHCQSGCDRTGLFAAFYRIAEDARTLTSQEQQQLALDAANEMRDFGQHTLYIPSLYPFVKRMTKSTILADAVSPGAGVQSP